MRPVLPRRWRNLQALSWVRNTPGPSRSGRTRGSGSCRFAVPAGSPQGHLHHEIRLSRLTNELRKATRNRVQFTNNESALKTLWLMICNIKDKRSAKRAKEGQQVAASTSRLVEGEKVSRWKQTINQMTVAYPDHFDKHL